MTHSTHAVRAVTLDGATPSHDRRSDLRRPIQHKVKLTVLDGPSGSGQSHDVLTRGQPLSGMSFLLKDELKVGTTCRLDLDGNGRPSKAYLAEVVRSRLISNGRYEMAVQIRKPL